VLIIEAAADTCMPPSSRERLWRAMGRPERIAYLYDHRMAFLAMTFLGGNNLQQQIYRFLDLALLRSPATEPPSWPTRQIPLAHGADSRKARVS
jgi:hypothetical protein